jgi:hypothetical protein
MKTAFIFLSLFSTATFAQNYRPLAICGDRDLVIDQASQIIVTDRAGTTRTQTSYQMVLKNDEIIGDFISKGAFRNAEVKNKGEILLNLTAEAYSNTQFYGVSTGNVTTVKVLDRSTIEVKTFSSPSYGSRELAEFTFEDCRLLN